MNIDYKIWQYLEILRKPFFVLSIKQKKGGSNNEEQLRKSYERHLYGNYFLFASENIGATYLGETFYTLPPKTSRPHESN